MSEPYSPLVRTFCQLRESMVKTGMVARHEVRPDARLDDVMPAPIRSAVWKDLKVQGLRPPAMELSAEDQCKLLIHVVRSTLSVVVFFQKFIAVFAAIPFAYAFSYLTRHRAKSIPLGMQTVGELVIYLTRFRDHRGSGYRWTTSEIEMKVRLIVAEQLGLTIDKVLPETTWRKLEAC